MGVSSIIHNKSSISVPGTTWGISGIRPCPPTTGSVLVGRWRAAAALTAGGGGGRGID